MKPHPGSKLSCCINLGYDAFMTTYAEVTTAGNDLPASEAAMGLQEALSPMLEGLPASDTLALAN